MTETRASLSSDNSESAQLTRYLRELAAYRPLSDARERALSARILAGDLSAREELVQANLKFVVSIARQYKSMSVNMLDLINEGNLALVAAAQTYDARAGKRFAQYAVWSVRAAMRAFLKDKGLAVASSDIDNRHASDDVSDALLDGFASRQALETALATLPLREQEVLRGSFGIGQPPLTLQEIAHIYNISRSRVKDIRKHALRRLSKEKNKIEPLCKASETFTFPSHSPRSVENKK